MSKGKKRLLIEVELIKAGASPKLIKRFIKFLLKREDDYLDYIVNFSRFNELHKGFKYDRKYNLELYPSLMLRNPFPWGSGTYKEFYKWQQLTFKWVKENGGEEYRPF